MTDDALSIHARFPAITRETLLRYALASGDRNPVHINADAARAAGFPDVFAQGMLIMAYLGRAVTDTVSPYRLRALSTRFTGITRLGDELTCREIARDVFEEDGERRAAIELEITNQHGEVKLVSKAIVSVDPEGQV